MDNVSHLPLPRASATRRKLSLSPIWTIVSGGQTGADRAALLWAIPRGLRTGGWCPKNFWAEDGRIPAHFRLRETPSPDPAQRTEWNVRDSDATILFSSLPQLLGGSLLTAECARKMNRPMLHLHAGKSSRAIAELRAFLLRTHPQIVNVAGSRASEAPHLAAWVRSVLERAMTCPRPKLLPSRIRRVSFREKCGGLGTSPAQTRIMQ